MNEETERPLLAEPVATVSPPPPAALPRRPDVLPWLCGVGFLILAAAIFLAWQNARVPPEALAASAQAQASMQQVQAFSQRVAGLESRIKSLEDRPPQVQPVVQPAPDLTKLNARVEALETRSGDPAQLGARVDVVSGRIEALANRLQVGLDAVNQKVDAIPPRVAPLEKTVDNLNAITARVDRLARIQDAMIALNAGKPVGAVPNAPPALAAYATKPPPTIEHLRLTFPDASKAALAAEQPDLRNAPLADRMWERAQSLVTVKRGGDVVVGNQSATALAAAQTALNAGDLQGAVSDLSGLADAPKQAMAGWLTEAKALLGARAALADLAGHV
jgi:hypothetical protein